jgi:hypothetical protein
MKKRPSLRPKKKSRSNIPKTLMVNRKLLIIALLLFLFLTCYIKLNNGTTALIKGYPVQESSNYKIILIDNSTGGDVSNNTVLMENINKTPVISELIETAKKVLP